MNIKECEAYSCEPADPSMHTRNNCIKPAASYLNSITTANVIRNGQDYMGSHPVVGHGPMNLEPMLRPIENADTVDSPAAATYIDHTTFSSNGNGTNWFVPTGSSI